MEGEDQKQFICRYCSKRYPCGKSLGGHLRSHRTVKDRTGIENVVRPKPKLSPLPPLDHNAASESAAYMLRENPKKTWRLADSRSGGASQHHLERFCKECGKGFQSMKALCGHMACHSDKDKVATKMKFSVEEEKEVLDSQSDTETTSGPRRGKRSKRLRYKTLDFNSNSSMFLSVANGSSSVSEIEQEQEEVAMGLMMLSRDCGYRKVLNSFAECSDNSSIVLEAKSSSIDMNKNGAENPGSGYFRKVKSDVGLESLDAELGKRGNNKQLKQIKADQSTSYGPIHSKRIKDHELWELCHKNGTASASKINGCYDSICESGENSIEADSFSGKANKKPVDQDFSGKAKNRLGTKKTKGHECPICFRDFKSGQALGGHKRSHFIGGPDDRTLQVQGLLVLDLNLPAPDEEEDMPGSWQVGLH